MLIELVDTQKDGSERLGKRRSPAGGFVSSTRFVVQSLCGLVTARKVFYDTD